MGIIGLRAVEAKGYVDVEVTCEGPFAKPPQACFLDGVQVANGWLWLVEALRTPSPGTPTKEEKKTTCMAIKYPGSQWPGRRFVTGDQRAAVNFGQIINHCEGPGSASAGDPGYLPGLPDDPQAGIDDI